ncbi:contains similarity to Antirrhinum majus SAP1 protein (GB:AJ132349) [Arabidopsis thaliana]|uniref:AT-hook motif nuclear-localized protein n=1 Tax=Arabidopsis thaliana TaxID=3702 RepID=Q9LKU6_ARATH|nr:contains similarity to Antirrhinum majus SAP1 protein (GB:AJ132349) [Arabidopsis thaliana]
MMWRRRLFFSLSKASISYVFFLHLAPSLMHPCLTLHQEPVVCLSNSDGQIFGGGVGGLLKAAGPVQVVLGTFQLEKKKDGRNGAKGDDASGSRNMLPSPSGTESLLGYHPDMESSGRNPNDEHHTITSSALGGGAHFMMKPPQGMHMTHARPSEWGGTGYDLSAEVEDPARCEIGGPPAVDGSVVASLSVEDGGLAQPNVLGGRVSRQSRKRRRVVEKYEEKPELEVAQDIEDDCAVYGDDDCNGVDDAIRGGDNDAVEEDANDANDADGEDANDADGEDANDAFEEDANLNIEEDFHEAFRVDEDGSDHDSGDDIWDEDRIPDPLSSDDEDEVRGEEETTRRDENEPEGLLALEKTYNSPNDSSSVHY